MSHLYRLSFVAALGFLGACSSAPPVVPTTGPAAKLRVAVNSPFATNFNLYRAASQSCGSSSIGGLGFFHPEAGEWQRDRRKFGLRQNLLPTAQVPENMYAEHKVSVAEPFFLSFSGANTGCSGVLRLPLEADKDYEFLLTSSSGVCRPQLFVLNPAGGAGQSRSEVPLASPQTGFACAIS